MESSWLPYTAVAFRALPIAAVAPMRGPLRGQGEAAFICVSGTSARWVGPSSHVKVLQGAAA